MLFDLPMGVDGGTKFCVKFMLYLFRYILDQEYTHKGGHAPRARSTAPVAIAFVAFLCYLFAFSFHDSLVTFCLLFVRSELMRGNSARNMYGAHICFCLHVEPSCIFPVDLEETFRYTTRHMTQRSKFQFAIRAQRFHNSTCGALTGGGWTASNTLVAR